MPRPRACLRGFCAPDGLAGPPHRRRCVCGGFAVNFSSTIVEETSSVGPSDLLKTINELRKLGPRWGPPALVVLLCVAVAWLRSRGA